jgi:hypothetical protein
MKQVKVGPLRQNGFLTQGLKKGNFLFAFKSLEARPAVSHISQKTSEMWGTRRLVTG